eukprot:COSAG04_NODE_1246_length_7582_cov_2.322555_4_plen_814_part_00
MASHVRNFTAALTPSHELLFLHEVMADGVGASRAGESNATDVPFDMTGVPLTPLHVKALKDGQWEDRGQFPVPGRPVMVTVYNHDPRWPRRGSGDETGYVELDLRDADGDGLADVVLASGEVVGWDAAKASWVLKIDDESAATTGPPCSSVGVTCAIGRGEIEDSALGLTEVVWVGPEQEGVFVGSPSIVSMPNRTMLASHDFYGKKGTLSATVQVLRDDTGLVTKGSGWRYSGNVSGIYWAVLFLGPDESNADVYLIGASFGDAQVGPNGRSLVISRSTTYGATWTRPAVLFAGTSIRKAGFRDYSTTPTPVIRAQDGRLYKAMGRQGTTVVSTKDAVDAQTDLLAASSWRETTAIAWSTSHMVPTSWTPPVACHRGRDCFGIMEGNAVEASNGTIYSILRVDGQSNVTYNKAVVFRVESDPANPAGRMVFDRTIDFPSTSAKFSIRRQDRGSARGTYYTLSTSVTTAAVAAASHCAHKDRDCEATISARNNLVLAMSTNLLDWHTCSTLLTDDTGFDIVDSARFTGFQYADWQFDTDDADTIHFAMRTAYRGAAGGTSANRLTVKTVRNVSALCADASLNATRVGAKSDDAQAELSLLAAMDAARSTAVAPRLGVARKAAKPLFEQDRPWEPHIDNGYPSVIHLPHAPRGTAQWLLFYDAFTTGKVGCSFARTAPFQNTPPACANEASLYAESGDGLSGWTKPSLGVCPWPPGAAATKANMANNIIKCPWHDGTFENVQPSVFRDTGPSAPRAATGQPPVLTSFGMWGTKPTDSREDNCGWNGYVARSYDAGRTWVNRTKLLTEDPNCEGG